MAQFTMTLPIQTMREVERLYSKSLEAYEMMTQAGAQVVYDEVKKNMRYAFKEPKKLEPYGVVRDKSLAISWYKLAAKQGNGMAILQLKQWNVTI